MLPWYIQPCTRSGLARASAAPSGRNSAADLSDRVPSSSMTSTPSSRSTGAYTPPGRNDTTECATVRARMLANEAHQHGLGAADAQIGDDVDHSHAIEVSLARHRPGRPGLRPPAYGLMRVR